MHIKTCYNAFFVPADVLAAFKAIPSVTFLAFKGSTQHIQKGHLYW